MLSWMTSAFIRLSYKRESERLGKTVRFSKVPKGFLPGFARGNLTSVWQDEGMPVRGIGMFTMGAPGEDGASVRFDPDDELYQAWFGAYLVDAPDEFLELEEGVPNLNHVFSLAIEDQLFWLRSMGDPHPVAFPLPGTESVQEGMHLGEREGTLVEVKFKSHADIGNRNADLKPRLFSRAIMKIFQRENPDNGLSKKLFETPEVERAYAPIVLQGLGLILTDEDSGLCAVGFACTTERHFSEKRDELLDALLSIEIVE